MSISLLLSDERLSGPVAVRRLLRPARAAHLVDRGSLADATALVRQLCDTWGGAYHLMIPVERHSGEITEPWLTLLRDTAPSGTATRTLMPTPKPGKWPRYGGVWADGRGGMSPIEALARIRDKPELTVRTANGVDPSDPWYVAYVGYLGLMPKEGEYVLDQLSRLVPGTTYDDLVVVDRSSPTGLGVQDLVEGARRRGFCNSVDLSCANAPTWRAWVDTSIGDDQPPLIPLRFHEARQHGSNLVVIYEPGSVDDLCLLWHLRAVHGLPAGLPLAIPDSPDAASALDFLTGAKTLGSWGLRPTQGHLVSASLSKDRLGEIAAAAESMWTVANWADEMQPSSGCGTGSTEVLLFDDGQAKTSSLLTNERDTFRAALVAYGAQLELEVYPVDRPLPPAESLGKRYVGEYRSGHVIRVSDGREVVSVNWPSGITVMQAVVKDHGLLAAPSQPGRVAEALLKSTANAGGLTPLMHSGAQRLLTTVSHRHGMNWFKSKLRSVLEDSGADLSSDHTIDRLAQIEARIEKMASSPNPEEQPDVTFSAVRGAFGDTRGAEGTAA